MCVSPGMTARNGTDEDASTALKTFSALGYKPRVANDLTVAEMKAVLLSGNIFLFFQVSH